MKFNTKSVRRPFLGSSAASLWIFFSDVLRNWLRFSEIVEQILGYPLKFVGCLVTEFRFPFWFHWNSNWVDVEWLRLLGLHARGDDRMQNLVVIIFFFLFAHLEKDQPIRGIVCKNTRPPHPLKRWKNFLFFFFFWNKWNKDCH